MLVIDDLGYLPQGAEESEVLFTLIAELSRAETNQAVWRSKSVPLER